MSAAPILTILRNGETIRKLPIEGEAVLGRSENCLIRLEDRAISRQHVAFKVTAAGVQVEKKSEFAPLLVNGKDCTRAILKEGDIISLGPYVLTLAAPVATAQIPAPGPAPQADPEPLAEPGPNPPDQAENALDDSSPEPAVKLLEPDLEQPVADPSVKSVKSAPLEIAPLEAASYEAADDDAKTKLTPAAKLSVKLVFQPGQANVDSFELTGSEISIGRGKNCDVILNDKKASRKNTLIRKAGMSFVLKDLGSSNGTLVNGARVTETELSGDDVIRIGDTEFRFVATSVEYAAQKDNLLVVTSQEVDSSIPSMELALPEISLPDHSGFAVQSAAVGAQPERPSSAGIALNPVQTEGASLGGGIPGLGTIAGVPGAGAAQGNGSLIGKFRALPKRQRLLIIAVVGFAALFLIEDPKPQGKKAVKTEATATKVKTYDTLTEKEKAFVESKLQEAAVHFQKGDYDSVIEAAKQVLTLIPNYDKAMDFENLAMQRKESVKRAEEIRRAREEAERLKARIASLVQETGERMKKKEYAQARELFAEVLALDPDNADVAGWRREIEEIEEEKRRLAQEQQVRAEINRHSWGLYRDAVAAQKAGNYHLAIRTYSQVVEAGATDKKLLRLASAGVAESREAVASKRDPLMSEAKQLEDSSEYIRAYQLYYQASQVDPVHKEAHEGMFRLRGILHEKAKGIYTEAILAESYSDFATARQKFQECLTIAPREDIYYERAKRKLANYLRLDESTQ